MRDARPRPAEKLDRLVIKLHAVRVPHIRADPAQRFHVVRRVLAEDLQRIADIVVVLSQMRVERHAIFARENGAVPHQILAHREGRARRDDDAQHRETGGIVIILHEPLHLFQDRRLLLDHAIGRQAALRLADAHRAARRMKPDSDLVRGLDGIVKPGAVRVDVEVIRGRRAAGEHEFAHRGRGRDADHLGRQVRPDRVMRLQPTEEFRILPARRRARQRLHHVVMRIDEAGQYDMARKVDDLVGLRQRIRSRANRDNLRSVDQDEAASNLAPGLVHRRDDEGILEKSLARHVGSTECKSGGKDGLSRAR